ncbi:glycosyltransferase family 4 protein [bacterium]|nr:glycosyltransferase family 4 protein [bacterium]
MDSGPTNSRIKCVHLPSVKNVYIDLLQQALEDENVEVEFHRQMPTFGEIIQQRKSPPLYHFHWLNILYRQTAHTFAFHFLHFYIKLVMMKRWGFPIVWTMHNVWPHDPQRKYLAVWAQRLMARAAKGITVHCDCGRKRFEQTYGQHPGLRVIPPGNYASIHALPPSKQECRKRLGIPDDSFVFLSFGFLRKYKGIQQLLDVFPTLPGEENLLILAGNAYDRSMRTYLGRKKAQIANLRVDQRFIPEEEVPYYYGAADVVVAPFTAILNSASVMMAMTMGKPVIAPAIGCIPEQVPADAGFLYDPETMDGLQKAMQQSMESDLEMLGTNARAAAERFPWSEVGRAHRALYQDILNPGA